MWESMHKIRWVEWKCLENKKWGKGVGFCLEKANDGKGNQSTNWIVTFYEWLSVQISNDRDSKGNISFRK